MIDEIGIRDLGVIDGATLELGTGFTAITGETGAGKTMVVTALSLLLGERADSQVVRAGASQASVEGRWSLAEEHPVLAQVADAGGSVDPIGDRRSELIVSRSVSAQGRSRAHVGGRSAPVGVLADVGSRLVVVHGQASQARLRSASAQREALDRFAGPDFQTLLGRYRDVFARWQAERSELEQLVADQQQRADEAAALREALEQIEALDPQPGEDDELGAQAERLGNREELRLAAARAREALSAELTDDALDVVGLVSQAQRALDDAKVHDVSLGPLGESLTEISEKVADASGELSSYLASLDADAGHDLDLIEERRAALADLCRRYGPTLDDVLELRATGGDRLLELDQDSDRIDALTARVRESDETAQDLAGQLSERRTRAATTLGEEVTAELTALAMPDAVFSVAVTGGDQLTATGRDRVEMLLQPHAGAGPRALGRGASGGELSRVMLAIEVILAVSDPVDTFVFDEVDAGVGGASATEVGRRLARLARTAQVIVVTHLAQVAAFATNHVSVVKDTDGTFTASGVRTLTGDDRVAEMARLLSGLPDSATGLEHARELVTRAQEES